MTTLVPGRETTAAGADSEPTTDTVIVFERMMAEFEGRLGLAEVTRAVRQCWQDLARSGSQPAAATLEQCARDELARRCRA